MIPNSVHLRAISGFTPFTAAYWGFADPGSNSRPKP
jgi:hypothetical protein